MTVITENFQDLAGDTDIGYVEFYCFNPRRSSSGTAVITQTPVTAVLVSGVMTSPPLDPGPARAVICIGNWRTTYDFVVPPSGTYQLFTLPEIINDPSTQKPTVQGPPGATGPAGPTGPPGTNGTNGTNGTTGATGPANSLSIGTVTGGLTASASIGGTPPSQTLSLVLPKGDPAHWFDGSGAPGTITGQTNGDHYLNRASGTGNGDVYQLASGTWTLVGNIAGPAGTPTSATTSAQGIVQLSGVLGGTASSPAFSASGGADASTSAKGVVQLAGDLAGTAASPTVPGLSSKQASMQVTGVKTSAYTAAAGDIVPCNAAGGAFAVALPAAPADKTRVTLKKVDSTANAVTINCSGSDAFNAAGGSTSLTLSLQYQALTAQYAASSAVWYVVSDDVPLGQLDARYAAVGRQVIAGTGLTGGGTLAADRTLAVSYGTAAGTAAQGNDSRITGAVQTTRQVLSGTGLTGGGDLSADRTLAVAYGTTSTTATVGNDTRVVNAVQSARQVLSGTGLTGGGDLTADRTLAVSYGTTAGTAAQGNDSRITGAAPLASPTFTGTPAAPTATAGTNTTQLATTAFVQTALSSTPVTRTLSYSNGGQGSGLSTYLSVTRTQTGTNFGIRIPIRPPANMDSYTVKIRNYNQFTSANGATTLTLDNMTIGAMTAPSVGSVAQTGNFSGGVGTTLATSGTIPNTSSFLSVSGSGSLAEGTDYVLGISFHAASSTTLLAGIGQCWYWSNNTSAHNPATAASGATSAAAYIPLDVVIEYSSTNSKKAFLVIGDSICEGTQGIAYYDQSTATNNIQPTPLHLGFLEQWCRRRGNVVTQRHCLFASTAQTWASSSYGGWSRMNTGSGSWSGAIIALGANDIAGGRTFAQLQTDYTSCISNAQAIVGTSVPIYAVTVMPESFTTGFSAAEGYRLSFNAWLAQLPYGVTSCIDFDSALRGWASSSGSLATNAMDFALSCDGIHPSYQGSTVLADTLMGSVA